jgi:hypothetical protein
MKRQSAATPDPKRERVAVLLASGMAIKHAAAGVRVGERTVHRWLEDPEFNRLVGRYRGQLVAETLGKLAAISVKAVETLTGALGSDNDNVRVRAALGILDQLVTIREVTELEQRLTELEGRLPGAKSQGPA